MTKAAGKIGSRTLWLACAASVMALTLTACSNSGAGLLTGSTSAPPKVDEPADRSLMVAATSARATRCGYNFDAARLRASYLAHERNLGTAPESVARAEKAYDLARDSVAKKIAGQEDYCSDATTAEIKRELSRHLAGNFDLPPKKAAPPQTGWFGSSSSQPPMDREKIFNPLPK